MTIHEAIYKHRRAAKLTQAELSKRSGESQRTIVYWEAGRGDPPVNACIRMARAMGIGIGELLEGVNTPEDEEAERADRIEGGDTDAAV